MDEMDDYDVEELAASAADSGTGGGVLSKMSSSPGIESMRKAGQTLIGDPEQFVTKRDQAATDYATKLNEAITRLRQPVGSGPDALNLPLMKVASAFLSPTKTGAFSESLGNALGVGADAVGRQRVEENQRLAQADNLEIQKAQFSAHDTTDRMKLGQQLLNAAETSDARRLQALARSQGPFGQIMQVLEQQGVKPGSPEWQKALKSYGNRLIYGEPKQGRAPDYRFVDIEEKDDKGNKKLVRYRYNMTTGKRDDTPVGTAASEDAPATKVGWSGDEEADALGVPILGRDPFSAYADPKARDRAMMSSEKIAENQYKEIVKKVRFGPEMVDDLNRAEDLINKIPKNEMGGIKGALYNKFGVIASEPMRELSTIVNKLTPTLRVAGSGSTSDFDAKMFQGSLFGIDKPYNTNYNVIKAMKAQVERNGEYMSFLNDYRSTHKTLSGADQKWREYINANPIFDRSASATGDRIVLNSNRSSYQDYFRKSNSDRRTPVVRLGD